MCFLFGVGKSNREAKGRSFPFTHGKANTMRGRAQRRWHLPAPGSELGADSVLGLVWTLHRPAFEDGHDKVPSVPSKSPWGEGTRWEEGTRGESHQSAKQTEIDWKSTRK